MFPGRTRRADSPRDRSGGRGRFARVPVEEKRSRGKAASGRRRTSRDTCERHCSTATWPRGHAVGNNPRFFFPVAVCYVQRTNVGLTRAEVSGQALQSQYEAKAQSCRLARKTLEILPFLLTRISLTRVSHNGVNNPECTPAMRAGDSKRTINNCATYG